MSSTTHITVGIAFLAGLVSFVSPCVLPLVPAYLSLLTGTSLEELRGDTSAATRANAIAHALAFILGFTVVFVALGLTASAIGGVLSDNRLLIAQVGGCLVVILGLQMMGMLRIPFLMMDTRVHLQRDRRTYWSSGIVGIAFAAGWSPCIGPILAGILAIASQQHNGEAAVLLLCYSLGLAVPFFLTALAIGAVLPVLNRIKRFLPAIEFVAGLFLVAVGLVLVNNAFLTVAGWFYQFVPTPKI
ncbi:MAG TPA: cytochrome c biogenesis protein CcdA [Candidatus Baltobacteraceae bacterium]|nr:cytochrome c biogenesis protein CcdA [Candidatus Baltobacteraceae bacterium]